MDNTIQNISNIQNSILPAYTPATLEDNNVKFEGIFGAALNLLKETSQAELDAEKMQTDFVMGKNDDILGVMIAQEKAYSSLQFTVQVANKALQAYQELMRLQL